ncbi:hypothetical protein AB9K26_06730 [Psychroserpens sp. XS_ASV72]|uniref:hypothetical protein n=1 Tax=Psychroserpens sp. XS_ASV72 TaxID=3241293 RepID=UPI00351277A4
MLKQLALILVCAITLGCQQHPETKKEKEVSIVDGTSKYEVYQSSEMASLMKGMHAYNMQLKAEVQKGEVTSEFPEEFLKIHSAEFSENKSRTQTFDHYSGKFIEAQKAVFEEGVKDSLLVGRYNEAINMCLSCHKTECTGPIPKIKKLLIK